MRKRILIADDEIESLHFIQDALEDYGYSVISVDNPESAIKIAKQSFFDLILLDINMPSMNGVDAFQQIKSFSPLSTVIMMTAGAPETMVKKAVEAGSFAVFYKPFKLDQLVGVIEKALNRVTVLVVDDLYTDRAVLADLLEQRGNKCVTVENGPQAIEVFKHGKPDVVFVDIKMPEMDGFEVLEKIKQLDPDSDVIMMSAYLNNQYLEKAIKMGAFTCMNKPLKIDSILDIIDKLKKQALNRREHFNIMLVEDDVDLRLNYEEILRLNNYVVTSVGTGKDAISESKKKYHDAVVMDLKLPDMSGIEAIKKIKEVYPGIVAIIITGHESLDAALAAIREKVFDFLVKPVDPNILLKSLKKGIEASKKELK